MHIFAGLFRLKANNKMGHDKIWFLNKIQTFLKDENHKMNVKQCLSLEKQSIKYISTFQSLIKQRRSETFVFQKEGSKYLAFLKIRGGKRQRPFCINQCILLLGGNSKSYKVSETKCDHRKLMKIIERLMFKYNKTKHLCTLYSQMEIKLYKPHH